ncbi:hypothetical protein L7Q46_004004 [Serratia marcescens]|nr:hypothetical protein [Serratia marcescens]
MKMAKSSPLSMLKNVAAQMMNIKRDMRSELTEIRQKISSLEEERRTIEKYALNRSDLLTATIANIDNIHNELAEGLKGSILTTARRSSKGEHYGGGSMQFFESSMKGGVSEPMFVRVTGYEQARPHELLFLYNHEEIKRTVTSAFNSISDEEWPPCSSISGTQSVARFDEIDIQITELKGREVELVSAANNQGIDIGQ